MVAIIGAIGVIVASGITSFATASNKVSVVEERENNHYSEVQRRLEGMEKKLDTLIENSLVSKLKPK